MSTNEFYEKLDALSAKAPENRHSYYQLKYFILGKEPTIQAQLWQCLRQLQGKKENIDTIRLQIEDTKDDIQLLEIDQERLTADVETCVGQSKLAADIRLRKSERKIRSLKESVNKLERKLDFEIQEARFYIKAFEGLESVQPLKDFDDFDAQKEYWEAMIGQDLNLRLLLKQPISTDLIKTALSLHEKSEIKEQTAKLLDTISNKLSVEMEKDERKQIK
jgi:hypothetical protein